MIRLGADGDLLVGIMDAKAKEQVYRLHIEERGEPWAFRVRGEQGQEYRCVLYQDRATCECPGFRYYGRCKHLKHLLQLTAILEAINHREENTMPEETRTIAERLREPFPEGEVMWKPQTVKGNRCLALAYIDARCVQRRLDEVVGVGGWADDYDVLDGGTVVCHLMLKIDGEWITKADVGCESDQRDAGDRRKAAFSDALKRAAVKFGIGRYLYEVEAQWVDYDPRTKQIVGRVTMPHDALPPPAPAQAAGNGGNGTATTGVPEPEGVGDLPPKAPMDREMWAYINSRFNEEEMAPLLKKLLRGKKPSVLKKADYDLLLEELDSAIAGQAES